MEQLCAQQSENARNNQQIARHLVRHCPEYHLFGLRESAFVLVAPSEIRRRRAREKSAPPTAAPRNEKILRVGCKLPVIQYYIHQFVANQEGNYKRDDDVLSRRFFADGNHLVNCAHLTKPLLAFVFEIHYQRAHEERHRHKKTIRLHRQRDVDSKPFAQRIAQRGVTH